MSLAERSKHFMKQFPGSKMNYTLLSRVYKMHGVKKRRITCKKKSNNRSEEDLKREKKKLLRQLEKLRKDGYRIIYLDETMFTKQVIPNTVGRARTTMLDFTKNNSSYEDQYFYIIMFVLIFYTHRENVKRLINKEESKTKIY